MLFICFSASSQKIASSKKDNFTGGKVVYTSWETIYSGGATAQLKTFVRFAHESGRTFMQIRIITNQITSVSGKSNVDFKTNKGIFSLENQNYAIAVRGGAAISMVGSDAIGLKLDVVKGDFEFLLDSKVEMIRYHFSGGYFDISISDKNQQKLSKMYNLLLKELAK